MADNPPMPISFKKAPLVELIAELRWLPSEVPPAQGGVLLMAGLGTADEEFFMRFGGVAYQHGFPRSERLFPPGAPMVPYGQPLYRYRRKEGESPELLQVGKGLFSANALKPYQSWSAFRPVVEAGVNSLLESRNPAEKDTPLSSVSLRYVNSFGAELTGGMDPADFVRNVLHFDLRLPDAITSHGKSGETIKPELKFNLTSKNGLKLRFAISNGKIQNVPTLLLDMSARTVGPTEANAKAIMEKLDAARNELHGIFIGLTHDIEKKMDPEGTDDR